jgi:selenocysteine lyase/cysteine desulfurase
MAPLNRRRLLASSLLGAAATLPSATAAAWPAPELRLSDPDQYWKRIREDMFCLPGWRSFLNNGSLGIVARPVLHAVVDDLRKAAALQVSGYPRWGYETLDEERGEMAGFLGCKKDELAFTHCATESMSMIAAGIDLKAGDEVLITNEEHPSGREPWLLRARRDGIQVREAAIPLPPESAAQLADRVLSAIGPRTRVLSFSGILTNPGTIMPVREICTAARAKGILTVVDGAHMNGQIPVDLSSLNCDYYAGSPHKWMFAPAGCGLLYIREENLDRLWPTIVSGNWDNRKLGAARFMQVGTNNRAIFAGLMAALRFLQALGAEAVYERIHHLARRTYQMAAERPWLELFAAADPSLYGSLVTIGFRGKDPAPLFRKLNERRIWVYQSPRLRLACHIHTRPEDLDVFFETVDEVFGKRA